MAEPKNDRQLRDQQRRLESLVERRRIEEEKRRIITQALNSSAPSNKKIVFNDSDEDEDGESSRPQLFQDDADPDLEEQPAEELLKSRLEGAKSEKLMRLEAKYRPDDRFKLNEKFLEDEEVGDDGEIDPVKSHLAEKKSEFSILSKVLGHEVKSSLLKTKEETPAGLIRPFRRFDPANPEHVKWMEEHDQEIRATVHTTEGNAAKRFDVEAFNNELQPEPIVVEGQFFEVDPEFAASLKKKEEENNAKKKKANEPFSFLASLGRHYEPETSTEINVKWPLVDESEQTDESAPKAKKQKVEPAKPKQAFIDSSDPNFKHWVSAFSRQQPMDKIQTAWQKSRDIFINRCREMAKSSRKNAANAQREQLYRRKPGRRQLDNKLLNLT